MIWNYPHAILLDGGVLRALSVKSPYRIVYKAVTPLAPEYSTWEPSTKATVTSHALGACKDGVVWPLFWISLFAKSVTTGRSE